MEKEIMSERPTFVDVLKAKQVIKNYLNRTPLYQYPALSHMLGCELYVKHENHQPTGAFKIRGGINLVSQLSDSEKEKGVVTASSGNHGISVTYSARLFGTKAKVVLFDNANPGKVAFIESLGGEPIYHGLDSDVLVKYAEQLAKEEGARYIHPMNEPQLIAGVGTYTLEILEDLPNVDAIIVPVGGGSNAAGACIVAKTLSPEVEVIGVQSEQAPAVYHSWKEGRIVEAECETIADGLATNTAYQLPFGIIKDHLDDFVLVSENAILQAIALYFNKTHNLAEGAGAAPLAAAIKLRERLRGKNVAIVLTGGNVTYEILQRALSL
jgi:threonine dehydratase